MFAFSGFYIYKEVYCFWSYWQVSSGCSFFSFYFSRKFTCPSVLQSGQSSSEFRWIKSPLFLALLLSSYMNFLQAIFFPPKLLVLRCWLWLTDQLLIGIPASTCMKALEEFLVLMLMFLGARALWENRLNTEWSLWYAIPAFFLS